ncbi:MAG: transketolase C-terminal domain-containing protein [Alphaproteobacteria bacterium]|nr:transketolase C-terminal domain-containing protein [Alphaproteobacteria bacterium]
MSKSIRQQFADTMLAVGQRDTDLVVIVGDISHGILQPFAAAFPDRYYNIGILEPTMMSLGAGMSSVGLYPVLHTIAPFLIERSFEQLKLDFCYHQLHGNVVSVGAAFDYSYLGCTHHCYDDFALLKTLQGSEICTPASAAEFDALFLQTYRNSHLTVSRLCGQNHGVEFRASDIIFGKAAKIADGSDVTLVAVGSQLRTAMRAQELLADKNLTADILYIHTVRPIDIEPIRASALKTRKVVVLEEHMRSGGFGDDVLRHIYEIPDLRFHSLAIPDVFVRNYGSYDDLCESVGLTPEAVVTAVLTK